MDFNLLGGVRNERAYNRGRGERVVEGGLKPAVFLDLKVDGSKTGGAYKRRFSVTTLLGKIQEKGKVGILKSDICGNHFYGPLESKA